jgi:hypothetical protein
MLTTRQALGHQMFDPAKVDAVVATLNQDDDFKYVVRHDPKGTGRSVIEVYDEDGNYIGLF